MDIEQVYKRLKKIKLPDDLILIIRDTPNWTNIPKKISIEYFSNRHNSYFSYGSLYKTNLNDNWTFRFNSFYREEMHDLNDDFIQSDNFITYIEYFIENYTLMKSHHDKFNMYKEKINKLVNHREIKQTLREYKLEKLV